MHVWTFLTAQLVKNPPAMQETWVGSLGWIPGLGRSPGEEKGYPLQYSVLENSMDCIVIGSQRVGHDSATVTFTFSLINYTVQNMPHDLSDYIIISL